MRVFAALGLIGIIAILAGGCHSHVGVSYGAYGCEPVYCAPPPPPCRAVIITHGHCGW